LDAIFIALMEFSTAALSAKLSLLPAVRRYLIAYSGGLDSTTLLHASTELLSHQNVSLQAVHVHHGLHHEADDWVVHCQQYCAQLGIPLSVIWVEGHAQRGESPEAAARRARYGALRPLMDAQTCLLSAHHQDDQAETLCLQLLRGAGPEGLAAMPFLTAFGQGFYARPLLEFGRAELAQYANKTGLQWIQDPSNEQFQYDRNFLRHRFIPSLQRRWPAVTRTIARAALLQAEAVELMSALATIDRVSAVGSRPQTLSVSALERFTPARQNNLLRDWIRDNRLPVPTYAQLAQVRHGLLAARADSIPCLRWPGGEMRRYRDDLYVMKPLVFHDPHQVLNWDTTTNLRIPHLELELNVQVLKAKGLVLSPPSTELIVRFRLGGERCQPQGRRYRHTLKKLLQEVGIPPWERDQIPLIYLGDRIIAVWGYWICE